MSVFREVNSAGVAERQAWRAYKAHCLDWRRHRNRPEQGIFEGDDRSHALFAIFRAARDALFEVSRPKWKRKNIRFQPRHPAA